MEYDSTNEKQIVVDVIKFSDFSELHITRVEDENGDFKAIDIRNWYCTRKDPTMKPTQKGVRIYKDNFERIMNAIKAGSN